MARPSVRIVAVVITVCVLLLSGCLVVKDSPAPGCVKRIGISPMGGCFGKTAILDLEVEPGIECLSIAVNNCNGGVLEVHNGCDETLMLEGVSVEPGDRLGLDVVADGDRHALVRAGGNFSEYVPETDEHIEVVGTVGERSLTVTFTKTARLCE